MSRLKKIIGFFRFIEDERIKAAIYCGTASNLY